MGVTWPPTGRGEEGKFYEPRLMKLMHWFFFGTYIFFYIYQFCQRKLVVYDWVYIWYFKKMGIFKWVYWVYTNFMDFDNFFLFRKIGILQMVYYPDSLKNGHIKMAI